MGCWGTGMRVAPNMKNVRLIGTMMPLQLLLLALITTVAVAACSGSDDKEVEATPTVTDTPTAVPTSTAISPTATLPPPTAIPPTQATTATVVPTSTATAVPVPASTPAPPTATPFPLGGEFFLNLIEPAELDVFATSSTIDIIGQTRIDAVVTINDDVVAPDTAGVFEHTVPLEVGINIIEVVGSVSSDEQQSYVITVVYLP